MKVGLFFNSKIYFSRRKSKGSLVANLKINIPADGTVGIHYFQIYSLILFLLNHFFVYLLSTTQVFSA